MKIPITKTEYVDIELPTPKYVTLHNSIFWKFEKTETSVIVTYVLNSHYGDIQRRGILSSDLTALQLQSGYKEITEKEFNHYTYLILTEKILPNFNDILKPSTP